MKLPLAYNRAHSLVGMIALLAGLLLTALPSAAEIYRWVDKDGKVQYSDKPPPEDATKSGTRKIDTKPAVDTGKSAEAGKGPTTQDLEADFKKRRLAAREKEEAEDKKAKEAEKDAETRKERCTRARNKLRSMQEGVRVFDYDAKGERVYATEDETKAMMEREQKNIAEFCKE